MIVVEAVWGLIPSSFWTQGIWGNLLCGGWFHYCGTCSTEACRSTDLSRDHDLGLVRPLADDTGLTLGGKCSSFFLVSGGGDSYPSSPVAHIHQSRYNTPIWGSFTSCGEVGPKLHHAWAILVAARACGSAKPLIC
jgi:hypothetical protein